MEWKKSEIINGYLRSPYLSAPGLVDSSSILGAPAGLGSAYGAVSPLSPIQLYAELLNATGGTKIEEYGPMGDDELGLASDPESPIKPE